MKGIAAELKVKEIPSMTPSGRKAIAAWLRRIADDIQREPEVFSKQFRARYWYGCGKRKG